MPLLYPAKITAETLYSAIEGFNVCYISFINIQSVYLAPSVGLEPTTR
jgi:hypothetical protein